MAITKVSKKKASTVEVETVDVVNEETENIDAEVVSAVEAETESVEIAATAETETAEAEAEVVTEAESESAEAVEAETVAASEEVVVYCGPTIKGVAKRNTVYKGLPKALSDYVEEHKYVNALIVPVSQFGKTLEKLRNKQSAESKIYNKILKTL